MTTPTTNTSAAREAGQEQWAIDAALAGNLTFGQTREVLAGVVAQRNAYEAALRTIANSGNWNGGAYDGEIAQFARETIKRLA